MEIGMEGSEVEQDMICCEKKLIKNWRSKESWTGQFQEAAVISTNHFQSA